MRSSGNAARSGTSRASNTGSSRRDEAVLQVVENSRHDRRALPSVRASMAGTWPRCPSAIATHAIIRRLVVSKTVDRTDRRTCRTPCRGSRSGRADRRRRIGTSSRLPTSMATTLRVIGMPVRRARHLVEERIARIVVVVGVTGEQPEANRLSTIPSNEADTTPPARRGRR